MTTFCISNSCNHVLVRSVKALGEESAPPRLALKANQCSHLYIEESEFAHAYAYAFAYVAVQYGHIVRSRFHHCGMAGICLKGGSAYHLVAANEVSQARITGIEVGEGTGFPYLVPPWLHYEAYDVKVVNNVVRDAGCGLTVSGGYNVLMAHNTCYRVGSSRDTIIVALGSHAWTKDPRCASYHQQGGWCVPGGNSFIPNRNIQICNNLIFNPDGFESADAHFGISGPMRADPRSNVPDPIDTENLRIEGNIVWNGAASKPVLDDVENCYGLAARPTVDARALAANNLLNTLRPELIDPEHGDFRPVPKGNVYSVAVVALENFVDDPKHPPIPAGDPDNAVPADRDGRPRTRGVAGAYT